MRGSSRIGVVALFAVTLGFARASQALQPVVVNVDRTVGPSQKLVATLNFPLPEPTTVTFTWSLTSEPAGLTYETYGFHDDPAHQPICEEDLVAGTNSAPCPCYPRETKSLAASGSEKWVFNEMFFGCHTHFQTVNVRAVNPTGSFHVRGTLRIAYALQVPSTILVSSPAAGAVVAVGRPFEVAWKALGQMANTVRIELIPDADPAAKLVLVASTPNDGSQSCTVPRAYPTTVKIRIVTTDNKVSGVSGSFTIGAVALQE